MKTAIYPGTFDPITNGHLDVVKRALKIFDNLIIAVSDSNGKTMFSVSERVDMIKDAVAGMEVQVCSFDSLLVDLVKLKKCNVVIRGLRAVSDFDYEFQMSLMNRKLYDDFETVFIMAGEEFSFLSASSVKEVASLGGDVSKFVPDNVAEELKEKFG